MTAGLSFLIAATGQWEKAMITVYLCGISTVIAMLIGVPIGIATAHRPVLWRGVQAVIDTLAIKCRRALEQTGLNRLVVAGGVSANVELRRQ